MTDRGQPLPAALRAARGIAARESAEPSGDLGSLAASLHAQCVQVCGNVRQSMGDDGCSALVGRAFARTEWQHPAVRAIRGPRDFDIPMESVTAAIEAHGGAATALAVDALLKAMHEILARLIGDDMARRILDHDTSSVPADDEGPSA